MLLKTFLAKTGAVCGVWASLLLLPASAGAQTRGENAAAAQALFEQARALVKDGKAAKACPKFAESQRLDPGLGTQLNLADCYERIGRTASAWTLYLEVAAAASKAQQTARATHARDRAERLRGKLTRLKIIVPNEHRVPGLKVQRNSMVVGEAQWGTLLPVDPGLHSLEVSAPGKRPWKQTVDARGEGAELEVVVPALEAAPNQSVSKNPPANHQTDTNSRTQAAQEESGLTQRTLALVVGGLGVVGLGVGAGFGASAISQRNNAGCDENRCPDSKAKADYESAQTAGNISTAFFIGGGVAAAAGVVLWLTAPGDNAEISAGVRGLPGGAELGAGVTW